MVAISLMVLVTAAVAVSAVLLLGALVLNRTGAGDLLFSAALLWLSNLLVFSLWYWEIDGGGPHNRHPGPDVSSDFLFPQMEAGSQRAADWCPEYLDYLFLAFNTSTAFSPTDTMVLARRAKVLMMLQSIISLITIAVLGRARHQHPLARQATAQRFPATKSLQVLEKQLHGAVVRRLGVRRGVRSHNDIRHVPERRVGRQWLILHDIQSGSTQMPTPQCCRKRRFVEDRSTSNIDDDRPSGKHASSLPLRGGASAGVSVGARIRMLLRSSAASSSSTGYVSSTSATGTFRCRTPRSRTQTVARGVRHSIQHRRARRCTPSAPAARPR